MNITSQIALLAAEDKPQEAPRKWAHGDGESKEAQKIRARLKKMGYRQAMRLKGTTAHVRDTSKTGHMVGVHDSGKWSVSGQRGMDDKQGYWHGDGNKEFTRFLGGR